VGLIAGGVWKLASSFDSVVRHSQREHGAQRNRLSLTEAWPQSLEPYQGKRGHTANTESQRVDCRTITGNCVRDRPGWMDGGEARSPKKPGKLRWKGRGTSVEGGRQRSGGQKGRIAMS